MRQNLALALKPGSDPLETSTAVVNACADVKAKDITVLNASKVSDVTDYIIITSGQSDRQVQGIANRVLENLEHIGIKPVGIEGLERGHWVIVDYGDVVVHVFYDQLRPHYNLEGLWLRAGKVELRKSRKGTLSLRLKKKRG